MVKKSKDGGGKKNSAGLFLPGTPQPPAGDTKQVPENQNTLMHLNTTINLLAYTPSNAFF